MTIISIGSGSPYKRRSGASTSAGTIYTLFENIEICPVKMPAVGKTAGIFNKKAREISTDLIYFCVDIF